MSTLTSMAVDFGEFNSWHFNWLDVEPQKQVAMAGWIILQNAASHKDLNPSSEVTLKFLKTVHANYNADLPFHTFSHAVDALHTCWRYMCLASAHSFLTGIEQFILLVSAISHDVGHFGLNNPHLIEVGHDIALTYNDKSPLENMHCATTFKIMASEQDANIFQFFRRSDFFEARRICIEAILHTDMVHHFACVKEIDVLYQMHADDSGNDLAQLFPDRDTKQKIMNLFLHSADVSNPCKPWSICHPWAMRCLEEFFNQGDQERSLGIPVQMLNDRTKVNRPFSQIGFVEFMIVPLEAAKVKLFPALYETAEHLKANMQEWARLWIDEVNPLDEERAKVQSRVNKACDMLAQARASAIVYTNTGEETSAEINYDSVASRLSHG
uniref:PDEase domain-containing protein n=1 Tax=Zooxanthella nutricula TaxID=1333877 RepID=A0A7S2KK41_9DINO